MNRRNHTGPAHADADSLAHVFPKPSPLRAIRNQQSGLHSHRVARQSRHQEALPRFNARVFLHSSGVAKTIAEYERAETIFTQGEPCLDILYIQRGGVKLTVLSKTGKEAVVAMLGAGDFFGEGCLTGQPIRRGSASAIVPSTILQISKETMLRLLRTEHAMSDCFIANMLSRNTRIEADLMDQRFNSGEERLARALLRLAQAGTQDTSAPVLPPISQTTLAHMVGTTRARVNVFMNKFKRLGFIEYSRDGPLTIHRSLLSAVLND
jgi:CRP/FNR family transcriptional regulator, cyclic AMP receptor protein